MPILLQSSTRSHFVRRPAALAAAACSALRRPAALAAAACFALRRPTALAGAACFTLCLLAPLTAAACFACRPAPARPPSLLLITVDSLRADRTGFSGHASASTPNMDRLAARGAAFTEALAPAPEAMPALASIHTGLYPARHGVLTANDRGVPAEIETLAEALRRAGRRTGAVAGALDLHPKYGLDQGFDVYAAAFAEVPRPRQIFEISHPAETVADRALEFLEAARGSAFFLWVNFYDPHYFYTPPAPFSEQFAGSLYDGEVAYVDRELGRVLAKLTDYGLEETTRIILAGTNGEGLGDRGEEYHGATLSAAATRVPLVVVGPGFAPGSRPRAPASLVDVAPTALALLGLPVPAGLDGLPLTAPIDPERPRYVQAFMPARLFGWAPLAGVVAGGWKYVEGARGELYDLSSDPEGAVDLTAARPAERERLAEMVAVHARGAAGRRDAGESVRERIRALGYDPEPEPRPVHDPRDRVDVGNDVLKAHRAALRRQLEAATFLFEEVLRRDPENYIALLDSALIARGRRRAGDERRLLERARDLYPHDGETYHQLGHLVLNESGAGGRPRAHALFDLAVALDPKNEEALYDLACTTATQGRAEEALGLLERAVQEGFRDYDLMAVDTDLDALRSLPRFDVITAGRAKRPAAAAPGQPAAR